MVLYYDGKNNWNILYQNQIHKFSSSFFLFPPSLFLNVFGLFVCLRCFLVFFIVFSLCLSLLVWIISLFLKLLFCSQRLCRWFQWMILWKRRFLPFSLFLWPIHWCVALAFLSLFLVFCHLTNSFIICPLHIC